MSGHLLESSRRWRATAEYHGSSGPRTVYLMDDGLIGSSYYWLLTTERQWPSAVWAYDHNSAARMIEVGKMRLVKGQWPDDVLKLLAMPPNSQTAELVLPQSHRQA